MSEVCVGVSYASLWQALVHASCVVSLTLRASPSIMPNGNPYLLSGTSTTLTTSSGIQHTGLKRMVSHACLIRAIFQADGTEKGEWPLSQNAAFEAPEDPSQPFDYNAVPERYYFNAESVGSIPVRSVIETGLDILVENLASLIMAVQIETGVDNDEDEAGQGVDGIIEPDLGGMNGSGGGGYDGYGGGGGGGGYGDQGGVPGWAGSGSGMSPLRR